MEIERKWLVDINKMPFVLEELDSYSIEQIYISYSPVIRIRKMPDKNRCVLTVKADTADSRNGLVRYEYELPITFEEYDKLAGKAEGMTISKRRYLKETDDGYLMEIDVFDGKLQGLTYLEIEFPDVEQAESYSTPEWAKKDVTSDPRYTNAALAELGMPEEF